MSGGATRPRALFYGTPEFAATVLSRLLAPDSPVRIAGVVTQPDRPVGRRQALTPPPVKVVAQAHDVPVVQPLSLRRPAALAALARFRADVGIVAAYGKILPPDVLAQPPHGHVNVHASLLPRWRGAWPVGAAILAGDAETGVSIMVLDEGMDTGPVLAARSTAIAADDTTESLERRLAALGADLLVEVLPPYLARSLTPVPQDDTHATYCRPVRKSDGAMDWTQPAPVIERHIRAMHPWPGATTTWQGKQLRIVRAHVAGSEAGMHGEAPPGTVVRLSGGAGVVTGEGVLALDDVQLEGRGVTSIQAFLNGYRDFAGSRLPG